MATKTVTRSLFTRTSRFTSLRPFTSQQTRSITAYGYTQSKALVFSKYGEPDQVLSLHPHSLSAPTSTSVTIRFLVSPINPADINQIQGVYPSKPHFTTTLSTPQPSAVAGNEGVAEVISAGSSSSLKPGDWVLMKNTAMGTWTTHKSVDESQLLKINKDGLTPLQAGTVSVNPCTAYRMLRDFSSWTHRGDEWFIQNGANSGVGRAAIQLSREWNIKSINVIRGREDKEEEKALKRELTELGATQVITEEELLGRECREMIKGFTNGGRDQIKLALNCVGGKAGTGLAKVLADDSALVTYGAMSKKPLELPAGLLIFKNIRFEGFWVSKWAERWPEKKRQTVEDVLRLTREGRFKDIPVQECLWERDTELEVLTGAVQGTLGGFRAGKGVFVFGET